MKVVGTFRTTLAVEQFPASGRIRELDDMLVDTGSEYTWIPRLVLEDLGIHPTGARRFRLADGSIIAREYGHAFLHLAGVAMPDVVIFAEENDTPHIGVHTIEGMNLKIDVVKKELVDAGPILAGVAAA